MLCIAGGGGMAAGCAVNGGTPAPGGPARGAAADAAVVAGAITGTVAYRERMALPADAIIQVLLLDVSRQDVAATRVAEATVRPEGRQVPLPFELPYDPAAIQPTHRYAVRAAIRSENRLLFTTGAAAPVITDGHPTTVRLMLARVRGPVDTGSEAPDELWGTAWVLEDIGGAGVIDDALATLEFPSHGKTAGRGACNRFFGSVEITADAIAFGPLGATRMACAEAVMHQEERYLTALQGAERYRVDGGSLFVYAKEMEMPLRFARAEQ